jgi:UDP-N-acetylglucosamine--N-acetylmuramyl-(pentapeptide) pyrophosphoryl-undecaprenol N-acetylglucosamine transferase
MSGNQVIISGGGTGGHLFPALVLGAKLQEKNPRIEVTFVGSRRPVEQSLMARHKVRFVPMRIEGLKGRGPRSVKALALIPGAVLKAFRLLVRLKPRLVVGVGSYSAGPVVLLASRMRIPTVILEQNVRPGLTNRMLIPWVRKAVVAFDSSLPYFRGKGVALGNPVREEFYALGPRLPDGRLSLLIFGGSQGSRFLNQAAARTLPLLQAVRDRLTIFHQTGERDLEWVRESYAESGFGEAHIAPFFYDMPEFFKKSDLVLGRSGATTCAELIASRKASILVPFARAADNHQALNAEVLKKAGGAEVILEREGTPQRLAEKILFYLDHPERLALMERNLTALQKPDAADRIAELCLAMMEERR